MAGTSHKTCKADANDRRFTPHARFPFPRVNAMAILERAGFSENVEVVSHCRSLHRYGKIQNVADRTAKPFYLVPAQFAGWRLGMNPRVEKSLIGVDVPHAGEDSLIQQGGLDGPFRACEGASQFACRDPGRLGAVVF